MGLVKGLVMIDPVINTPIKTPTYHAVVVLLS